MSYSADHPDSSFVTPHPTNCLVHAAPPCARSAMCKISVIIPVLHDEQALVARLSELQREPGVEVIVVDGGNRTQRQGFRESFDKVIWKTSRPGRGYQMNTGVKSASGEFLLFLHADTQLPKGWAECARNCLRDPSVILGAFRFRPDQKGLGYRLLECGVWLRCIIHRLPYGDQALFVRMNDFRRIGGFRDWPLLEDVEWVERMKDHGRIVTLRQRVITSAVRWEKGGILKRGLLNRSILREYRQGVPVAELSHRYRENKAAVIVFCKHPDPGKVKTRLAKTLGIQRAATIYKDMVVHTLLQTGRLTTPATTLVLFQPSEDLPRMQAWLGSHWIYIPQADGDLGEKMAASMKHAFAMGFRQAVIIGSDCPSLQSFHIDKAFEKLKVSDVVIGPAHDGGYYLIGANAIHSELFSDMEWSTPGVLAETMQRVEKLNLTPSLLETLRDVDTEEDFCHTENAKIQRSKQG